MRIIIETNERGRLITSAPISAEPALDVAIDGGAPSEMLIQAIAETPPIPSGIVAGEGINAGSPPEWLVQTVQDTIPPSLVQALESDKDAGAAPGASDR